jgi:hypothetical protein
VLVAGGKTCCDAFVSAGDKGVSEGVELRGGANVAVTIPVSVGLGVRSFLLAVAVGASAEPIGPQTGSVVCANN